MCKLLVITAVLAVSNIAIASPMSSPQGSTYVTCKDKDARYPIPEQCDGYIECRNGTSEEMMCPDGLRFRPGTPMTDSPCAYPIEVTCKEGTSLQRAQPTRDCPHRYGYFRTGDAKNCGAFRQCVEGRALDLKCPEGLAYNSATNVCEWPENVVDCDVEAFLGFTCPNLRIGRNGQRLKTDTQSFRYEGDIQKFYACVDGKPRLLKCNAGKAFDELTGQCEETK